MKLRGRNAKRVCIVTSGHLSTCPRMLKAADSLAEAGYEVRVVSARYMDWAWHADQEVRRTRSWKWSALDYDRESAPAKYIQTGVRFRSAQCIAKSLGPGHCPLSLAERAYSRAHTELVREVLREPADLIYGGTSGALAATAEAANRSGVPYALDLEDLHSAQHWPTPEGRFFDFLAERIERAVLAAAAFITAGSDAIARAYRDKYRVGVIPLHNTFPLPPIDPQMNNPQTRPLLLYWFGQTIGLGRGLETVVQALGWGDIPSQLHLRGRAIPSDLHGLESFAADVAPNLRVVLHNPAPPDTMVDLCRPYELGLATEPGLPGNNEAALSNKALTYILAGLAVVITDTPGQRPLARDLGEGALLYKPGDVATLAAGLKCWAENKSLLTRARIAAWEAARRRWHWEHPEERGALLKAVAGVFN